MLPNSVLRIHGERGRTLDVHDWFEPTHRAFVLFPHADARILDRQLAEEDDRPIRLIVPDGTWRQARRMVRRVAGLAQLPQLWGYFNRNLLILHNPNKKVVTTNYVS